MENFIEFQEGNVGIILSIPHGGLLDPEHVQDRQCQNCDTHKDQKCPIIIKNDGYTIDLGMSIVKSMLDYKSVKPNLVINKLRRSKLDPNREIEHGAQDNPEMIEAFEKYHDYIKDAKTKFPRGLLIDLHGQCKVEMTELGYLIPKSDLNDQTYDVKKSSVAKLFIGNNNNDEENIISGSRSLGTFIQSQGYDAIPSSSHPSPGDSPYFAGGYITQIHSKDHFDAIQLETPRDLRIDKGDDERERFGHALGRAICDFYEFHYMN